MPLNVWRGSIGSSDSRSVDQTIEGWEATVDNYEQVGEPFTAVFGDEALRLVNIKTGPCYGPVSTLRRALSGGELSMKRTATSTRPP